MSSPLLQAIQELEQAMANLDIQVQKEMPILLPNVNLTNWRSDVAVLATAGGFDMRLKLETVKALIG